MPIDKEAVSASSSPSSKDLSRKTAVKRSDNSSSRSLHEAVALVSQSSIPIHKSEIDTVLSLDETDMLLKHCKLFVYSLIMEVF